MMFLTDVACFLYVAYDHCSTRIYLHFSFFSGYESLQICVEGFLLLRLQLCTFHKFIWIKVSTK